MPSPLKPQAYLFVLCLLLAEAPGPIQADNGGAASTPVAAILSTPTQVVTPGQAEPASALPKNWVGEKVYTFDTVFGTKGSGLNELNGPEGICVGSDDNLYIADTQNNRIQVWTCNGQPIKTIGSYGPSAVWRNDPQFDHPGGVLILPSGQIYVADTLNNRIVLLDPDGHVLISWGSLGTRHRQFTMPRMVSKDHFGNIWVLDSGNSRISNFTNTGKFNYQFGTMGSGNGQMNLPLGMALNNTDQCIVSDTGNFRIVVFNDQSPSHIDQSPVTTDSGTVSMEPTPTDNSPVTVEGWFGDGPFQFKEPAGVSMTKTGWIAVADGVLDRVNFFNGRFEFVGQWRVSDENLNLASPPHFRGVACDSKNRLYITDIQNNCVIRLKMITVEKPLLDQIGISIAVETPVPTDIPTPTPDDSIPFGGSGFPIR